MGKQPWHDQEHNYYTALYMYMYVGGMGEQKSLGEFATRLDRCVNAPRQIKLCHWSTWKGMLIAIAAIGCRMHVLKNTRMSNVIKVYTWIHTCNVLYYTRIYEKTIKFRAPVRHIHPLLTRTAQAFQVVQLEYLHILRGTTHTPLVNSNNSSSMYNPYIHVYIIWCTYRFMYRY